MQKKAQICKHKMDLEIHFIQLSDTIPFKNKKDLYKNNQCKAKYTTWEAQHLIIMDIILIVSQ